MKDLKKMRENFERDLKLARVENKFEKRFGTSCHVWNFYGETHVSVKENDIKKVGKILKKIVADKMFVVNDTANGQKNPVESFYRIRSHRGYSDTFSELEIKFYSEGICYTITMKIDGILNEFFTDSFREMSSSELSTYKPSRGGMLLANVKLPCKKFNCAQIEYSGGSFVCCDEETITQIVNALKA